MAVQHGIPGEWARVRGTVLSLWPLFLSFILLGAFAAAALLGRATLLFAGLFLASLIFMSLSWRRGVRRVASLFVGARGGEPACSRRCRRPITCFMTLWPTDALWTTSSSGLPAFLRLRPRIGADG